MFDKHYLDWNQKRIKGILDFYGHKFLYYKKILDLGCGQADISGVLYRLGADITAVDARQEHLKFAAKKYSGIKTVKADLDKAWPYQGKLFDIVLDLDLICHLSDYENHLRVVCQSTTHLVLETAVCDSDDPFKCVILPENKSEYDASFNGVSSRPSAAAIERILLECGMNFRRQDNARYNSGTYIYDWSSNNNNECDINKRRLWFAVKNTSHIQFSKQNTASQFALQIPAEPLPPTNLNMPSFGTLQKSKQVIKETTPSDVLRPTIHIPSVKKNNTTITNTQTSTDKKFVIIIPSYNNGKWCEKNITSALNQNYSKFRIIFTDDSSSDDAYTKVSNIVNNSSNKDKCTILRNNVRVGALENLYNMIYSCENDEIIITLDGDDWLAHDRVLSTLNTVYSSSSNEIWMTFGQYKNSHDNSLGVAKPYPAKIIESNTFRQNGWYATHLRTFYSWLFKRIRKDDLLYQDKFMPMTWDVAMMYPMLEMSGNHSRFISDVLYVYNTDNPINDHKVNLSLQQELDHFVRIKPKYEPLSFVTFKELGKFGRVGNQMFQVANLISLAHTHNDIVKINWHCNYTNKDMAPFFKHKITNSNVNDLKVSYTYNEPQYNYNEIPYMKGMNLHGYFQSEKYFSQCKEMVRYYFEPSDQVLNKLQTKYNSILNSNTCSIHIRRGDYVNNKTHEVCNADYYKKAIEKISSMEKIDNFVVFSDDITWCQQNFPNTYTFVSGNLDIEDLFLMSLCKHNIIANSSFSWWGSWLNKNTNKIIIVPHKWFGDGSNNDIDVYTQEMIKI